MNPADCYHTGLVVDDMDAAARRLTVVMGYRWTKPIESTLSVTAADGDLEVPFKFVYSLDAPHLEVIQQVPGTIWTAPPRGGAQHHGYVADDIAAAAAQLERSGYRLETRPSGDALSTFAYFTDPGGGVRIEIVDRALFPDFPGFLAAMAAE